MNRIQLQSYTSTENFLVSWLEQLTAEQAIWVQPWIFLWTSFCRIRLIKWELWKNSINQCKSGSWLLWQVPSGLLCEYTHNDGSRRGHEDVTDCVDDGSALTILKQRCNWKNNCLVSAWRSKIPRKEKCEIPRLHISDNNAGYGYSRIGAPPLCTCACALN